MLPARNRKDFEDIPEEVRKQVEFVWLERVDEAVASALEPPDAGAASEKPVRRLADASA
jgi:ATP-dependent Lon protease